MTCKIDNSLHWTDHYVKYGFAVLKSAVDRSFCEQALAEIRKIVGDGRPLTEWINDNPGKLNEPGGKPGRWHYPFFQDPGRTGWTPQNPVLERVYDQPRLRTALDEMHGSSDVWDGVRNYYIFLHPYDPTAQAGLEPTGHIDFKTPVPVLYRGFTFQLALVDTDPFGGNTTIFPGTHVLVQKALMDGPDRHMNAAGDNLSGGVEPFEFIAEAGDVLLMHHLVYHAGNPSQSANHKPRVALHAESFRKAWLTEIDPSKSGLSPWHRSLAINGYYKAGDEATHQREQRDKYIARIESEKGITISQKWKHYSDWPTPAVA